MTIRIRLPRLHKAQNEIKDKRARYNVINCGRRFGKNVLFQDLAVEGALVQRGPVMWGAPTYRLLMDDWRRLKNILSPVMTYKNEVEKRIETVSGGSLQMYSLDNPDTVRGNKFKRVIINEAAFVPKLTDIWIDAVLPTLLDLRGDAYIGGTPKGRNGFWSLYNKGSDRDWANFHYSSYANPKMDPADLDALRADMTDRSFRQEILAEFLEDGGGVFRYVLEAATLTQQLGPTEGHDYIIAADWGRTNDFTCFIVLDETTREAVYIDRFTGVDFVTQRKRLIELLNRFGAYRIIAEYNSIGGPIIEELQYAGYPIEGFVTTHKSKGDIIDGLALAFEQRTIKIVNDPILVNELMAYESITLPNSGLLRYSAPDGFHDDTVIALAIGWSAIGSKVEFVDNPIYDTFSSDFGG